MGRHEDILADDVQRGPARAKEQVVRTRRRIVAGEAHVVRERIEPDVGDKILVERQLDAPLEAGLGTRDAEVAGEFFHGVSKFGNPEIGNDKRFSCRGTGVNKIEQPLAVLSQFEEIIFLLDEDDLAPLGSEFPVRPALFIGQKLFLPHAVISGLFRFVKMAGVPEPLEHRLHAVLVDRIDCRGPGVIADAELFPQLNKFGGHPRDKFRRGDALLLRGLLDFLTMLINACEEKNSAAPEPLVTRNRIGEHLFVGMSNVRSAVCVVDRGGDEKVHSFEEAVGMASGLILPPHEMIFAFAPAASASGIWLFRT